MLLDQKVIKYADFSLGKDHLSRIVTCNFEKKIKFCRLKSSDFQEYMKVMFISMLVNETKLYKVSIHELFFCKNAAFCNEISVAK